MIDEDDFPAASAREMSQMTLGVFLAALRPLGFEAATLEIERVWGKTYSVGGGGGDFMQDCPPVAQAMLECRLGGVVLEKLAFRFSAEQEDDARAVALAVLEKGKVDGAYDLCALTAAYRCAYDGFAAPDGWPTCGPWIESRQPWDRR